MCQAEWREAGDVFASFIGYSGERMGWFFHRKREMKERAICINGDQLGTTKTSPSPVILSYSQRVRVFPDLGEEHTCFWLDFLFNGERPQECLSSSDKNIREDIRCKIRKKMYEQLFKTRPSPGWPDSRRVSYHIGHNLDEYMAMGEWKEYSLRISSNGYLCLFSSAASRFRLAPESQQDHEKVAPSFLASHRIIWQEPAAQVAVCLQAGLKKVTQSQFDALGALALASEGNY